MFSNFCVFLLLVVGCYADTTCDDRHTEVLEKIFEKGETFRKLISDNIVEFTHRVQSPPYGGSLKPELKISYAVVDGEYLTETYRTAGSKFVTIDGRYGASLDDATAYRKNDDNNKFIIEQQMEINIPDLDGVVKPSAFDNVKGDFERFVTKLIGFRKKAFDLYNGLEDSFKYVDFRRNGNNTLLYE